jgi:3-(3-hydroxy-phenyl)propionate hydroxylase
MVATAADGGSRPPIPEPRLGPGVVLRGDPHAGTLFVQGRVARAGRTGLFDDVVGRGWTLLSRADDPQLSPAAATTLAALGGTVVRIGSAAPVRDVDGVYERWFASTGVDVVLQRPDSYVFGTAAGSGDTEELVGALARVLRC